ncbi:putative sulfate exporter family transporter [Georgenia yuyongxinii]|uniref:Putative sulfate exporter family transporter n=1 Tax=Georgenia yuyongxinii TaxID=2589797 RepID=A0A5B8C4G1_9MICO|nr:putative sulfate exporter family transporter [Georgenia yuyongxinii]QDC24950.1 putative sulfate exporter family transporter [Georgenia yuyongxinii]
MHRFVTNKQASSRIRTTLGAAWPPLLVAIGCAALARVVPLLSPLLTSLIVGAVVANTRLVRLGALGQAGPIAKTLLRVGIVLVGFRLSLEALAGVGGRGAVVIIVTVVLVFLATCWVGDRLGLDRGLVTLIASGFAICGAAAIAAVEGAIRRRDEDVALSIAMVTLFGSAMIIIVPLAGAGLALSPEQIGVWAGASIHEVAQVVAAASITGGAAVAVATTIKLGRVLLLGIVYSAARFRDGAPGGLDQVAQRKVRLVPWFVIGFVLAMLLRSSGLLPATALGAIDALANVSLAAGMFGLGLGVRFAQLYPLPWRVVGLSAVSTAVAASASLGLVVLLF